MRNYQKWLRSLSLFGSIIVISTLHIPAEAQQVGDCPDCAIPAGLIKGRVLDIRGRGVRGITVYALKQPQEKGMIRNGKTNSRGFFQLLVGEGRYAVYAGNESAGYPESLGSIYQDTVMHSEISVAKDKVTKVVLRLGTRLHTLSGRIVKSSTGGYVKDAQLKLSLIGAPSVYVETAPDLSGRFSLLSPPAPFTLKVHAPGYETKQLVFKPNSSKKLVVALKAEGSPQSRP